MNNRQNAKEKIIDFLASDKKALLLTGTHQNEKHVLVLHSIVNAVSKPSSILFRANSMDNLGSFFKAHTKNFKTGKPYKMGKHAMYIDTINKASWKNTKHHYDYAIIYPLDSVLKISGREEIFKDLYVHRNVGKIFIVSWTDHRIYNYEDLAEFYDEHVVFDALEENPAYHQRVINVLNR